MVLNVGFGNQKRDGVMSSTRGISGKDGSNVKHTVDFVCAKERWRTPRGPVAFGADVYDAIDKLRVVIASALDRAFTLEVDLFHGIR